MFWQGFTFKLNVIYILPTNYFFIMLIRKCQGQASLRCIKLPQGVFNLRDKLTSARQIHALFKDVNQNQFPGLKQGQYENK